MKKPGRNDPCPCGSGKKYKKCCEASSRFTATKLNTGNAAQMQKAAGLTSLFQTSTVAIPKKRSPEEGSDDKPDLEGKGKDLLTS